MGELFVFLFFGLVAVNGSYYVQLEELDSLPFWLSISVGLLSTAILVVNNVRDIDTDRRAGKRTLAVRLGRERTRVLYVALRRRRLRRPARSASPSPTGRPRRSSACSPRRSPIGPLQAVLDPHRRPGAQRRARRHRRAARRLQPPASAPAC